MGVLPTNRHGQIDWFEARVADWQTNAALIGLTPAQVTAFTALVFAARTAAIEATQARAESKAATVAFYNAVAAMNAPGRDYIATIKAFADTTNNPQVYVLSQIDPPAPPSPVPAPDAPTDLDAAINTSGVLTMTWKATRRGPSTGIVFHVERALEGAPWTLVAAVQETSYIDLNINACAGIVQYRVRAVRGEDASPYSATLSVNLAGGGGEAQESQGGGLALAA